MLRTKTTNEVLQRITGRVQQLCQLAENKRRRARPLKLNSTPNVELDPGALERSLESSDLWNHPATAGRRNAQGQHVLLSELMQPMHACPHRCTASTRLAP